jgi:hypothetical protein
MHFNNIYGPDSSPLYTFHFPNLISNFQFPILTPLQSFSPSPRLCEIFRNAISCYGVELLATLATTILEDTPCRMCVAVYSVYYQPTSILGSHLPSLQLKARHTVMTDTHLIQLLVHSHYYYYYYYYYYY